MPVVNFQRRSKLHKMSTKSVQTCKCNKEGNFTSDINLLIRQKMYMLTMKKVSKNKNGLIVLTKGFEKS